VIAPDGSLSFFPVPQTGPAALTAADLSARIVAQIKAEFGYQPRRVDCGASAELHDGDQVPCVLTLPTGKSVTLTATVHGGGSQYSVILSAPSERSAQASPQAPQPASRPANPGAKKTTSPTTSSGTEPATNQECRQVPTYAGSPAARVATENVPCDVALQVATTFYKGQAQVSPNSFGQYVIHGYDCASSVHELVLQCESGTSVIYAAPPALWSEPVWQPAG